ncbi:hypothetical protein I6F26_10330 [Ensifer sp. IC3342]|nr:hypothetical protein [Ensifer sp. BRP08]MCA1446975.1 hypothetical protein [Ensifer sp. IC3342]
MPTTRNGLPLDPNRPWVQASQAEAITAANRPAAVDPSHTARLKREYVNGQRR